MRKTHFFGMSVWVGLIWLTLEAYLGRLLAVRTERIFLSILAALNRLS